MKVDKITDFTNYFSYNSVVILSFFFICLIVLIINKITSGKINETFACRRGSIFNPMTYIRMISNSLVSRDWNHFRSSSYCIISIFYYECKR